MKSKTVMDDITADIRNKLTTLPKTVLEAAGQGKEVKKEVVEKALEDLNEASRLINAIPPKFPT
ncbi:MAG: hypothetical protein HQ579_00785 [Candidatus Omnitrophica bacterium]|nr:hypothetical protein [Candidatus Omnitrophota bacterium]